jgi:hypothetical protein
MKLYRVEYHDRNLGVQWRWCGTKAEADREANSFLDGGATSATVERVDVPEQKQPLIAWLNRYASDNNG